MKKLSKLILILLSAPCFAGFDTNLGNEILDTMCSEPRPELCKESMLLLVVIT